MAIPAKIIALSLLMHPPLPYGAGALTSMRFAEYASASPLAGERQKIPRLNETRDGHKR
jgi:hypothetical protein